MDGPWLGPPSAFWRETVLLQGTLSPMKVLLGITGCIAAYKSAELLRLLQKRGHDIFVVMTENAQHFITPLTMETLSRHPVITRMFPENAVQLDWESPLEHIHLANTADVLLVAPATANILGKFARGIADDFLTTAYLATPAPVVIAPAMNVNMWNHPAVQENLQVLASRGSTILEPEEGFLAEGIDAKGRLANLECIVAAIEKAVLVKQDLHQETVLITAGPTCEDLDPVRYLTNRSSGKMGYHIAAAARRRGASTLLVSGPTPLEPPAGVDVVMIRSAEEMRREVLARLPKATIVIKAAAVADFRPKIKAPEKIKKAGSELTLTLVPTPDILSELGRIKDNRILVGFAAETNMVLENARDKLKAKNLDLLVVNDVTESGAGFEVDTNIVTLLFRDGREIKLGKLTKLEVAHAILDQVVALRKQQCAG
jgi:phosphopantothenoylcysteine decarboxylase/phosphopantothenate--cysteine ligase